MRLHVRGLCSNPLNAGPALLLEDIAGAHRLLLGVPPAEAPVFAHELRRGPTCDPSIYTAAPALLGRLRGRDVHVWLEVQGECVAGELRWSVEGKVVLAGVGGPPIVAREALTRRIQDGTTRGAHLAPDDARAWSTACGPRISPETGSRDRLQTTVRR